MNIKILELLKLIEENPTLEIIPMVNTECVCSDDYSYWSSKWGRAEVDEYYVSDERIYFKSNDSEELIEEYMDNLAEELGEESESENIEQYAINKVNKLKWVKAIVVYIEPK